MQPSIDYDAPYPASPAPPPDILGNQAKSLHKKSKILDLQGFVEGKRRRYSLQRVAQSLLHDPATGHKQKYRVVHCGRCISETLVKVFRAADGSRARFTGLTTCGSGWMCPVCAQQIAEGRRGEASAALVQHVKAGGMAHLMTLTFSHHADEALAPMLEKFNKARQAFKNCRVYKRIIGKEGAAGCIGAITALEVTWGKANGWHPHIHMLLIVRREVTDQETADLRVEWIRLLLKNGLSDRSKINDLMERALDMRGGADAADYITKYGREEHWGLTSELTRAHAKRGEFDGRYKPFGLLQIASEGNEWAGAVFREFAQAFHGKRLLTWSPGLKKQFNLAERSDDELVDKPLPVEQWVGHLNPDQWKIVLSRDARAELLQFAAAYCEADGQDDLDDFVRALSRRKRSNRGWFAEKTGGGAAWIH